MAGEHLEKVLKLQGGDWYLAGGEEEVYKLSRSELRTLAEKFTGFVRVAYLKTVGELIEVQPDGRFRIKRRGNLNSVIYNRGLKGVCTEAELNSIKVIYFKDTLNTSIRYFVQKDILANLKEAKAVAIKSLPIIREAKYGVVRSIGFQEEGKRIKVIIELALFKNAGLRWVHRFSARKSAKENSYYQILRRIKEGEYELAYAGFGFKLRGVNTGPYLIFCYRVPVSESKKTGRIMGIDLGQECLAYFAVSDSYARGDLAKDAEFSPEWLRMEKFDWRRKIYAVWTKRKALQKELNHIKNLLKDSDDEILKSRKDRIRKELQSIRHYEANFMETLNKTIASIAKRVAEKEGVSLVVLEDLSVDPEKKTSLMFPKWNYSQLQTFIENKMREIGIEVKRVNPACTSLRCPECGYIAFMKEIVRRKRETFRCPTCGYKAHADHVGAKNLATEDIEEVINRYLKTGIRKLGGSVEGVEDKNHLLHSRRRKLIRELLNKYLDLPEHTSLKKALAVLKKRSNNEYEEFVKAPEEFFRSRGSLATE